MGHKWVQLSAYNLQQMAIIRRSRITPTMAGISLKHHSVEKLPEVEIFIAL